MPTEKSTTYVFFGTPEFAATVLEKFIEAGFVPVLVVCNPDRPAGRKKVLTPPPVKVVAQKYNIPVLQPENLTEVKSQLSDVNCQLFIVAAYAKILPKEIFSIPKFGTVGIHPSLLPRHRGATPIQSAILTGDTVTGVTLYLLDEKVDHGPIITGKELLIEENDTYGSLSEKLSRLGAELVLHAVADYLAGNLAPQVQNEAYATHTKKFATEDALVDLEKDDPVLIERKVRALNPEPGVWTVWKGDKPFDRVQGKRVKILEAELIEGRLRLLRVQLEGKKPQQP